MIAELFGGTGAPPVLPNLSPETQTVGFDEVTVTTMPSGTAAGGISLMGKCLAYTVPSQVDRAELRELAVHGSLEGIFQSQCWWQLQIEEGATQEMLFRSEIFLSPTDSTLLNPPRTSGFQFGRFGSLQRPQNVFVQLKQGQRLVIPVFTNANVNFFNLTVYVRVRGVIFTGN